MNLSDLSGRFSPAANTLLRFLLATLFSTFYPTYLFVVYMLANEAFAYDMFTNGGFGIRVFYFSTIVLGWLLISFVVSPWYLYEAVKRTKRRLLWAFGWLFFALYLPFVVGISIISAVAISTEFGAHVLIGFLLLVGLPGLLGVLAYRIKSIRRFAIVAASTLSVLLVLTLARIDTAADVLAIALHGFGVGGNLEATVELPGGREPLQGRLILRTPNELYLRSGPELIVVKCESGCSVGIREVDDERP